MKNLSSRDRIFIDCTYTWFFGGNTGIQRVVRNIIMIMPGIEPKNMDIIPVIWAGNRFISIPNVAFRNNGHFFFIRGIKEKLNPLLHILPERVKKNLRSVVILCISIIVSIYYGAFGSIQFRNNDILFLPDASWNIASSFFWHAIRRVKEKDTKIGFLFYDIIPLMYPEYCLSLFRLQFKQWFFEALYVTDFFITLSDTVRRDIVAISEERNITVHGNNFNYSGTSLDRKGQPQTASKRVTKNLHDIFDQSSVFIFVSTIEPRKNHDYAISAFESLWKEHDFPGKFFIIGKIGWLCEKTIKRILNHPEYKKRLFMMNDINDTELAYAYTHAAGSIFTSFAEGFGLPIIESISFGLPVFASDIPVHREIGGDMINYCDLAHPEDLARQLQAFIARPICLVVPASYKQIYSWETSCIGLLERIQTLAAASKSSRT